MHTTPSIDVLDQLQRAKTLILQHKSKEESLADLISKDRDAFSGVRLLFASDVSGAPIQSSLEKTGSITSLFCGKGMLAFSDEIEAEMLNGSAKIAFMSNAILDTNFLSDLPKFLKESDFENKEKINETLLFIEEELFGMDWSFACAENLREAVKPNNPWPREKVAAAQYANMIKRGERANKPFTSTQIYDECISLAERQWGDWLENELVWHQVYRRDLVYCIMLFTLLECWKGVSIQSGMERVINFCLNKFKTIPLTELYFAWKAFAGIQSDNNRLPIFDEKPLLRPKKNTLARISALSWDIFIFRWCETLITQFKGNKFYVPAITTFDSDLLATIKACPLRAVLIHDEGQAVLSIYDDELDFQKCLNDCLTDSIRELILDPARRDVAGKIPKARLSAEISALEHEIQLIVKQCETFNLNA